MSKHCFTDEQVMELSKNPNVERVSNKGITYERSFKDHFLESDEAGKSAREIFTEAGFDPEILGSIRIRSSAKRWRRQSKRLEGLSDTRKKPSGRPCKRVLTKDEIIVRQQEEIEYLKQERIFLLELKRLERQAIKKSKSSQKTSTSSSKK
ncbi:MAG: HTH domain-containing protein [Acholeplasmataceae bacterium]|jgi:hypothetical protein